MLVMPGSTNSFDFASDKVSLDTKNRTCTLSGHAEITGLQGSEVYKFSSERMLVLYDKKNSLKVSKVTATGGVHFAYGDIKITSQRCDYNMQTVVFKGEVKINDPKLGAVKADKATYDIKTKKIDILSKTKVNVVLTAKNL
jgi:lipopolysaccharide export system protein LptA